MFDPCVTLDGAVTVTVIDAFTDGVMINKIKTISKKYVVFIHMEYTPVLSKYSHYLTHLLICLELQYIYKKAIQPRFGFAHQLASRLAVPGGWG
jgi:hypothetical protein